MLYPHSIRLSKIVKDIIYHLGRKTMQRRFIPQFLQFDIERSAALHPIHKLISRSMPLGTAVRTVEVSKLLLAHHSTFYEMLLGNIHLVLIFS